MVPRTWMSGDNHCYFPKYSTHKNTTCVRDAVEPEPDWPLYTVEYKFPSSKLFTEIVISLIS